MSDKPDAISLMLRIRMAHTITWDRVTFHGEGDRPTLAQFEGELRRIVDEEVAAATAAVTATHPTRTPAFSREIAAYDALPGDFKARHRGLYIVIKGDEVIALGRDYNAVLDVGYRLCGEAPFFVRQFGMEVEAL